MRVLVPIMALAITVGIYFLAGWQGLVVGLIVILLFDFMHKRVYGKSIAEIEDTDYHDHLLNPKNLLEHHKHRTARH